MNNIPVKELDVNIPVDVEITPQNRNAIVAQIHEELEKRTEPLLQYPKQISYEASTVLCVLLSMNKDVKMESLPINDRKIIEKEVPTDVLHNLLCITVKFDKNKDFILSFTAINNEIFKLGLFNAVIHPPVCQSGEVPLENKNGKISIGNTIVLDKNIIKKLVGVSSQEKNTLPPYYEEQVDYALEKMLKEESVNAPIQKRKPVAGRNAFEIREDVLEAAIDVVKFSTPSSRINLTSVVEASLQVAKKFYDFVENKSR